MVKICAFCNGDGVIYPHSKSASSSYFKCPKCRGYTVTGDLNSGVIIELKLDGQIVHVEIFLYDRTFRIIKPDVTKGTRLFALVKDKIRRLFERLNNNERLPRLPEQGFVQLAFSFGHNFKAFHIL
jgi:hypothetical protein